MPPSLFPVLNLLSALAFILYGLSCLFAPGMKREFERFGLPRFRVWIGVTQLVGAGALLTGFVFPAVGLAGAAGLAMQMLAGIGVRIRCRDGLTASLQAGIFLIINAVLTMTYVLRL